MPQLILKLAEDLGFQRVETFGNYLLVIKPLYEELMTLADTLKPLYEELMTLVDTFQVISFHHI